MSRPLIASLSVILLAAALTAQAPQPEGIQVYPAPGGNPATNGTSFASRLTFGTAAGEALAQYPQTHFTGIGDMSTPFTTNNPTCALSFVVIYFQDQDRTTSNSFGISMRPAVTTGANAGKPDTNNTNAIFRFTGIPGPTTTGTGPAGWAMWLQFQQNNVPTPIAIPCTADMFFGIAFNANTSWPASDGLSCWAAVYDPAASNITTGDAVAPRTGVPNLTWEIAGATPTASQPTVAQVLDYVLVSPFSMLQAGARHKTGQSNHGNDDGFGAAGLFPSISGGVNGREDGLIVRVSDNPPGATPAYGGNYLLFLSISTRASLTLPPVQLGGFFGSVYLGPVGFFPLGGGSLSTAGSQTVVQLAPPGSIPKDIQTQKAKIYLQAATVTQNGTVFAITNMAAVQY